MDRQDKEFECHGLQAVKVRDCLKKDTDIHAYARSKHCHGLMHFQDLRGGESWLERDLASVQID